LVIGFLSKNNTTIHDAGPVSAAQVAQKQPSEAVVNSPWDGSVWQVERYLKKRLKDPESFEAVEWSQVAKTSSGAYKVRCVYRAKNSFGGYVVEQILVDLDRDGNVTNAVQLR